MSFVVPSRARKAAFIQTVLAQETADRAAQEAELQRRVKQEIAKLRESAMAEAKAAGLAQAQAALEAERAQLAQALAALRQAGAQLRAPLAQKEQELAGLVLEMGFLLARHIAGGESGQARAELGGLVESLLREAAAGMAPGQNLRLRLNPLDVDGLASHPEAAGLELVADASITPGGALAELLGEDGSAAAQWDARLEQRFAALRAALALPGEAGA